MKALLKLDKGLRVVVRLHTERLQKRFNLLLSEGKHQDAARLLRSRAEVHRPFPEGVPLPHEFDSLPTLELKE